MPLLLEEMPIDDFERVLNDVGRQVSAEGAHADDVRQIELARELRKVFDRYKRRGSELAALYETAGDLSSLREPETVLQSIVRRGRQLLATDVAYLMLIDEERGDTYMRVTEGTVTSDFIDIHLRLGVGLGGLVAQTAAPHWTANYLADHRYLHAIDTIVEDERLIAILGVPLKVGRRVIGVLFAADRHPRSFVQEEISLLSSLASHAAIAIENASLFEAAQAALTRLTEAMTVIERHNEALERAAEIHEQLTNLVLVGGSDLQLARTVVDWLGGTILVLDPETRLVARAGESVATPWSVIESAGSVIGAHDAEDVVVLLDCVAESRRYAQARINGAPCHVVPIVAGADSFGWLVFIGELGEADTRAVERAATVTALLHLNQRARDEAENRVRGELLAELLGAPVSDAAAIQRRAALVGVDLSCAMSVAVALPAASSALTRIQIEAARIARTAHGLVTTQGDRVVMLLPGADPIAVATNTARRLEQVPGCRSTVGGAGPVAGLSDVPLCEGQASRCAKTLVLLGREGQGATAQQLGLYGLLLSEAAQGQVKSFIEATLGPVEQYDTERGTALLQSVEGYFDHDCNVALAAHDLFVHPNTLYQRLDRVDQILSAGWRTGDRALEIRLALRLRRLASC